LCLLFWEVQPSYKYTITDFFIYKTAKSSVRGKGAYIDKVKIEKQFDDFDKDAVDFDTPKFIPKTEIKNSEIDSNKLYCPNGHVFNRDKILGNFCIQCGEKFINIK